MNMLYTNKNTWYVLVFLFVIAGFTACDDDDAVPCNCKNQHAEWNGTTCQCPDNYYTLGILYNDCDPPEERTYGECVEKTENAYMLYHDCKCTEITNFDSLVVRFNLGGFSIVNAHTSGYSAFGHFEEKADGNEFSVSIPSYIDNTVPLDECEGTYPFSTWGNVSGKFNPENTYCEAMVYWSRTLLPDSTTEIIDSCLFRFVK